jgi:LysM repeat protein
LTRLDLKAILAILLLNSLLLASACNAYLPPSLEEKAVDMPTSDAADFPLKSLDTPTSLPTLTPTTPPETESAYPAPLDESAPTAEASEAVAVTEAVAEVVVEATLEPAAETTPEPVVTEVITETVAVETTELSAETATSETVTQAPVSLTEVLPPADLPLPQKYTLQRGEFPYCIARRYNVNPVELMRLNYLSYRQFFHKGLVIWLPQSGKPFPGERAFNPHTDVYVAQKDGETIFTAACYYGDVDPSALAAANGLPLDAILSKGQQIFAAP